MHSWSRKFLIYVFDAAPSIVFFGLLRFGYSFEAAGWVGSFTAALVLFACLILELNISPLMLAINIHLLVITPLIVATYRFGSHEFGDTLSRYSYQGVLITILIVGIVLTLFARRGFIGIEAKPSDLQQKSLLLLAASAAVAWSFLYAGATFLGVGLPIIAMFVLRQFLLRRA